MDTLSVTGQLMDTLGQLSLSLRIRTTMVSHTFQVVRGVSRKFLLGWDFFCAHRINLHNGTTWSTFLKMCLFVARFRFYFLSHYQRRLKLILQSNLCVPSMVTSLMIMLVFLNLNNGSHNFNIAMARTLSPASDGQTTVRIMNPTNDDINLYPGTRIGHFYSVSDDSHGEYTLSDFPPSSPQVVAGHSAQKCPLPPVDLSKADISPSQLHQLENLLRWYTPMCLAL